MVSATTKSKKGKNVPPRNRPTSSSGLSQPVVEDASSLTSLSAFSPQGNHFASLSLAIDKHRLRIHDTTTGQSISEHVVQGARVATLSWAWLPSTERLGEPMEEDESPKKKRKKRDSFSTQAGAVDVSSESSQVVLLGLSNGSISIFSPTHGRVLRTLSHSSSAAAVIALSVPISSPNSALVWASSADSSIHVWNLQTGDHLSTWKTDDRIPCTSLSVQDADTNDRADILLAHHSIHLLSTPLPSLISVSESQKPRELATFTGHASNITSLRPITLASRESTPRRFVSMAEADRHVYVWEVPEAPATDGKLVASIPLDSDARQISTDGQHLLILSASGKISVFHLDTELGTSTKKSKQKVPTLNPSSTISVVIKRGTSPVEVVSASAVPGQEGSVRVAWLLGGIRPLFDVVRYLDDSGNFVQDVRITPKDVAIGLAGDGDRAMGPSTKRYAESSSMAVRSGIELGQDASVDDLELRDIDGALDVDLAELSLGQRLTALDANAPAVAQRQTDADSDSSAEDDTMTKRRSRRRRQNEDDDPNASPSMSSITLTRTLIQALHSSDSKLLEMCLAHSDPGLIMNTVRRLPPQLAVPLLVTCVDRLGRGKRVGSGKGGGAGASSQRGTGLVRWVKTVLVVHSGHLMTMPDLVARLSGLHATLTTRLTLQDSLLSLSGKLDMVLQQIELRSSTAPAPISQPSQASKANKKGGKTNGVVSREPVRYIEGESEDDEEEAGGMDVEIEEGSDAGSVEDVELGGGSDSEEDDEDEEELDEDEEDDEDDEEGGVSKLNGFIDDEAEEDEDSEESE